MRWKYTGIKINESWNEILMFRKLADRRTGQKFLLIYLCSTRYKNLNTACILRNISTKPVTTKEREDGATKWDFLLAQRIAHGEKQAQMGKTAVLNARDTSLWGRRITRCSRQRSPSRPCTIKRLLLLSTVRFLL